MTAKKFQNIVWQYYKKHRRDLPWRRTREPYKILVSEVMLQQTQVSRVAEKYKEFIKRFPNFHSLALASTRDVLSAWSGLGYNRRALYLKRCAEIVTHQHGGKLPKTMDDLVKLPGIGKNTAGAVLAYAYNFPAVFIETNIRRVYIHCFFAGQAAVADAQLLPLIEKTVDAKNPREWYWALMDYGAHLSLRIENPNRRSKHYARQSKFQGSLRQVRGEMVRLLLQHPSLSYREIAAFTGRPKQDILKAAEQLEKEGFLAARQGRYLLLTN